jgi:fluoride ion exporter CrcB/FEX
MRSIEPCSSDYPCPLRNPNIMDFTICALVVLGGLIGGSTGFVVSDVVGRKLGATFPWGTLVVNVSGALAIAVFAGLARLPRGPLESASAHAFVVTGLLGGYTTVSWRRSMNGCSSISSRRLFQ